jgi:site-specific DNA recombinase
MVAAETATPQDRLMFQMLGSFAEFEKSNINERTRDGLYRAPLKATPRSGSLRLPCDDAGWLEVVEEEARIVEQIISNIAGGSSLYSEAQRLNALGVRPPSAKYESSKKR